MRKFIFALIVLALVFLGPVQAADHFNAGTIAVYESHTSITYVWTLTVPALGDSAGSWHSRPMYIADCNAVDGYYVAFGTAGAGTEDHNILLHYSYDNRTTWFTAITKHNMDALGATAVHDTLGIESTANVGAFHNGRWLVAEYDGQASNESNRLFTFVATMTKDLEVPNSSGGYIKLGRYATKNETNP